MPSNFDFLRRDFPLLAKLGALAEKYSLNDANSALTKLGVLGETIVNLIFDYDDFERPEAEENTAAKRIEILRINRVLPREIANILHILRKARNRAVHENYDSESDALALLSTTFSVCEWFAQTYGSSEFERRPFVPPTASAEPVDVSESAEEEIEPMAREASDAAKAAPRVDLEERRERSEKADFERSRSEAETRAEIDDALRRIGWEVDSKRLRFANGARPEKGKNRAIAEWPVGAGDAKGFADYALFLGEKLVALVEAKAANKDVFGALDAQCKEYARSIRPEDASATLGVWGEFKVPFVFSTNGRPYLERLREKSGVWFQDLRRPTNPPKAIRGWFRPGDFERLLKFDVERANRKLLATSDDFLTDPRGLNLRPYQVDAVRAAERAILDGKKSVLLAMATGTGKTRTVLGLIYHLLKAERFRRILFLVDRVTLGNQATEVFKDVKLERLQALSSIYNVADLKTPERMFERETKVVVSTVQSVVRRVFGDSDDPPLSVADFDLIIVDEAHRGYALDREMGDDEFAYRDQSDFQSKYRAALEYFDAVKIGLTATPALHTTSIFGAPVFKYTFREAVLDGCLVDYDAPHIIETELSRSGIEFRKGDVVDFYNPETGEVETEKLDDEALDFDVADFNRRVVDDNFNRVVLEEIAKELDPNDRQKGKTLIFAVDDKHADAVVAILKDIFARDGFPTDAVAKITCSIGDKKVVENAVSRFKNELFPSVVVTVDLLTTGVDVPAITKLVYLRRMKSRILFEQTIGRATRLCPEIGKERFEVYDAVGVFDAMSAVGTMKPVVAEPKTTFAQLFDGLDKFAEIPQVRRQLDRVVAKLRRKARTASKDEAERFRAASGGLKLGPDEFADKIVETAKEDPEKAKALVLENRSFFDLLEGRGGSPRGFVVSDAPDALVAHLRGYGKRNLPPEDYLDEFARFVNSNRERVEALELVCVRPRELTRAALKSLKLKLDAEGFEEKRLNEALSRTTDAEVAENVVGLIRHYAIGSPLESNDARVDRAVAKLRAERDFTDVELKWLERIEKRLKQDGALTVDSFADSPFKEQGGFARLNKIFNGELAEIVRKLVDYMYDDEGGAV